MDDLQRLETVGDEFIGPGGIRFKITKWRMRQDSEGVDEIEVSAVRSNIYDQMYPKGK